MVNEHGKELIDFEEYEAKQMVFNFDQGYNECNGKRQTGRTTKAVLKALKVLRAGHNVFFECHCRAYVLNMFRHYAKQTDVSLVGLRIGEGRTSFRGWREETVFIDRDFGPKGEKLSF